MGELPTKVELTNLNKVLFPMLKIKKAQVIEYYIRIAPKMLAYLSDRPLVLARFPDGVDKEGFYEKDAPEGTPHWVRTVKFYSKTARRNIDYILCNDIDTLIWLANLAAIEIHIPLSCADSRQKPDFVLFDMDPKPPASYGDATEIAILLKEILERLGLKCYAKTSGKKGLHVVIPIVRKYDFRETRAFTRVIGEQLAKEVEIVTTGYAETEKSGKVLVDYLQNSHGRTMVSPYSLRVVQEATVSTPLEWAEVKKRIKPTEFNIFSVIERQDAWKGILEERQKLEVE